MPRSSASRIRAPHRLQRRAPVECRSDRHRPCLGGASDSAIVPGGDKGAEQEVGDRPQRQHGAGQERAPATTASSPRRDRDDVSRSAAATGVSGSSRRAKVLRVRHHSSTPVMTKPEPDQRKNAASGGAGLAHPKVMMKIEQPELDALPFRCPANDDRAGLVGIRCRHPPANDSLNTPRLSVGKMMLGGPRRCVGQQPLTARSDRRCIGPAARLHAARWRATRRLRTAAACR